MDISPIKNLKGIRQKKSHQLDRSRFSPDIPNQIYKARNANDPALIQNGLVWGNLKKPIRLTKFYSPNLILEQDMSHIYHLIGLFLSFRLHRQIFNFLSGPWHNALYPLLLQYILYLSAYSPYLVFKCLFSSSIIDLLILSTC